MADTEKLISKTPEEQAGYGGAAGVGEGEREVMDDEDLKPRRPLLERLFYYNPCSYYLPRRYGVATLAFLGFCNVYALRVNLSVAIVAMSSEEFNWGVDTQGLILSTFFYGYIVTQIPGGWLSNKFGGKKVFGYGMLCTSVLAFITPVATRIGGVWVLVGIRVMQGLAEGVIFPACHGVWSHWSPVHERSRLATIAFSGSYVGTVISLVLSGFLAQHIGWASIFYFFGTLAFLWSLLWLTNVGETPAEDKRISEEEINYITTSLGNSGPVKPAPWLKILTSLPVWAINIAHFAENWGFYTLLTFLPRFMKDMFDMQLSQAGLISALPYMFMAIVVQIAGFLADYFRATLLSTTVVRKLFTCGAFFSQTVFMLLAAYVGTPSWAIACITCSVALGGFAWAGFSVNHLDLAPQYASVLMGLSNTFATIPGMVSPTLAGNMLHNGTIDEWREVFFVSAGLYTFGAVAYGLLASGETQKWAQNIEVNPVIGGSESD